MNESAVKQLVVEALGSCGLIVEDVRNHRAVSKAVGENHYVDEVQAHSFVAWKCQMQVSEDMPLSPKLREEMVTADFFPVGPLVHEIKSVTKNDDGWISVLILSASIGLPCKIEEYPEIL